jgi:3-oxoacyl-[acyl-carrier-protein] synthase II
MMSKRRVVVTGMGSVTPLGLNVQESWDGVIHGKSGVTCVDTFDVSLFPSKIWAIIKNFDPTLAMDPKEARRADRFTQYGMAAAQEAMRDSGIEVTEANAARFGVAVGSGIGGLAVITQNQAFLEQGGPRKVSPFFIPTGIINALPGHIAIQHGVKGPNISIVTACTTGTHNIGYAARIIAYGDADIMLAGGAETCQAPVILAGFAAARALSKRNDSPEQASRPFDRDRDGFVLGEGAGVLVLEEYEHAKKRGAKIYAELIGFGASDDAFHITSPDETSEGASLSISNALKDAGINPEDVDYINAHGTSTMLNDLNETKAIKRVFGQQAYKVPVSSTKSMTGHLLGAAGAVEAIFCILAIQNSLIPPTLNLDNPGETCDLDYVPNHTRETNVDIAISNSFGFGGTNGTLVFKKI